MGARRPSVEGRRKLPDHFRPPHGSGWVLHTRLTNA